VPTGARADGRNNGGRDRGPCGQVGRHRLEPGLTSAAAAGGTGTQADGQGGADRGEQGAAGAGWGGADRSPGRRAEQWRERSGPGRIGGAAPARAWVDECSSNRRDRDPGGRAGRRRLGRAGRGRGWAGRSLTGVEDAAAAGGEEAQARPGRGERGAGA
jgi:hypothetical protein